MLRRVRISCKGDLLFPFSMELYNSSFPMKERRSEDYHLESMRLEEFHADVVLDGEQSIGILFWWELEDFRFIEHFATCAEVRGKGYGAEILAAFIAETSKPILLEVEHPIDELSTRRVGFYKRVGFYLNPHPYAHPSYQQLKDTFVSLQVMSFPLAISSEQLQKFTDNEFPRIHFRSYR